MKLLKQWGLCFIMVMFVLSLNIHTVDAATYTQGKVIFDDLAQTPEFYLTKGEKILHLTKQATKDASFLIQLTNIHGQVVDTCKGDAYTFETEGKCFFQSPANDTYYLTFVTYDTTSTMTIKYRLDD